MVGESQTWTGYDRHPGCQFFKAANQPLGADATFLQQTKEKSSASDSLSREYLALIALLRYHLIVSEKAGKPHRW